MKILFFSSYYDPYISGLTTYPKQIFSSIAKNHSITILTFPHKLGLKPAETVGSQTIIRMPFMMRISKGFLSLRSLSYFFRYVQQADVILINIPNAEGIPLVILARLFHKPIIAIYHCNVDLGNGILNKVISLLLQLIVLIQLYASTVIVGYTRSYVAANLPAILLKNKIRYTYPPVLPLPIDSDFQSQLIGQKKNSVWIGFAGRIAREKGILELIHASQKVQHDDPNHQYILIFAGPFGKDVAGENTYYQEVLAALKTSGLSYHLFGNLKDGQLGAFYKTIDFLVLPSINSTEAFGMVQVEAMLLGTPVVASDLPGVRVPIEETGMGRLVNPHDSNALSNALQSVISNRQRYVTPNHIAKAKKIFNSTSVIAFYEQLLEDMHHE